MENTKNRSQTRKEKMEEKKFDQKSSALSELKVRNHFDKGLFFKPSGKMIVAPNLCFFELETSNFG